MYCYRKYLSEKFRIDKKMNRYNKYRNKKTKCNQDHMHDSKGEAGYCDQLALMKKIGEIKDYEIQKIFILDINKIIIAKHIVDFWVTTNDNKNEVHEYKGWYKAPEWKLKKKIFEAIYSDIPYIIIK